MILTSNINWDEFLRFLSIVDRDVVRKFDEKNSPRSTYQFIKMFNDIFPNDNPYDHIHMSIALKIPQIIQPLLILRSNLTIASSNRVFFLTGSISNWKRTVIELLTNCVEDIDIFYQEINTVATIIESIDKNSFVDYKKVQKFGEYFELRRN
jgi:hypothetical protein